MDVKIWTYNVVGLTFDLNIGIAIWSRIGSSKEFYVAGGGVSPLVKKKRQLEILSDYWNYSTIYKYSSIDLWTYSSSLQK